jgi:hypothetical protein
MQVVHMAGVPPNQGRKYFPNISCTAKSKKAPRNIVTVYGSEKSRGGPSFETAAGNGVELNFG